MATDVEQLQADVTVYTGVVNDYSATVDSAFAAIQTALADAVAKLAAAGIDHAAISALDTTVKTATDAVAAEKAKLPAATPAPVVPPAAPPAAAPPASAPADLPPIPGPGGTAPLAGASAGAAVTGDPGTATAPPAEAPAAAPAAPPVDAQPAAPAAAAVERTVYTFSGTDETAIDHNQWPDAGAVTSDTPPKKLYLFSGDTAPGDVKGDGVGGEWHVYTGAKVQA